jgi:hypothetical protein
MSSRLGLLATLHERLNEQLEEVCRTGKLPSVRRPRRPSIGKLIAKAEQGSGRSVTSITTPDGHTIRFGEPQPTEASNPFDSVFHEPH